MKSLLALLLISVSTTAYAQATPDELGKQWAQATREGSVDAIIPLIHPDCPKDSIKPEILARMVEGGGPPDYSIRTEAITTPEKYLDRLFFVRPEKNLTLSYAAKSETEKRKVGLGKSFPIAVKDGRWYFVVCTKE